MINFNLVGSLPTCITLPPGESDGDVRRGQCGDRTSSLGLTWVKALPGSFRRRDPPGGRVNKGLPKADPLESMKNRVPLASPVKNFETNDRGTKAGAGREIAVS